MISEDLPLIDLHRHVEGTIRLGTILELAQQHNLPLPARDEAGLRPYVQVTGRQPGVMAFIEKFNIPMSVLADLNACQRIAAEAVWDAAAEGIDYLELRFSPWFMAAAHALPPQGVVEAVIDGVASAAPQAGIMVNLLGILSRTYGPEVAQQELNALLPYSGQIIGLDLAGDEANFPAELFSAHFQRAQEAGLKITVHAGEADGPESIWKSIELLGASRIGHGLAALQDERLMETMFEHQIGIETNLTSNVQTSSVRDYASHPLRAFLKNGLLATINSDDPAISGINLRYEYDVAAPLAGLSHAEIRQAQVNALECAFLKLKDRRVLLEKKKPTA